LGGVAGSVIDAGVCRRYHARGLKREREDGLNSRLEERREYSIVVM
jgi:hypothetical protein